MKQPDSHYGRIVYEIQDHNLKGEYQVEELNAALAQKILPTG